MNDEQTGARVRESLAQVRTAYRLLQAYHRRLFDLLEILRDELSQRIGKVEHLLWSPTVRDRTPDAKTDPLMCWVLDFEPLSDANVCWVSDRVPTSGSYFVDVYHRGDSALDAKFKDEPDPGRFPNVDSTKTTLSVYFRVVREIRDAAAVHTWPQTYEVLEKQGINDEDPRWEDGACHVIESTVGTVVFAGFTCDMADLGTREAIERNLIEPLVRLLREAKQTAAR